MGNFAGKVGEVSRSGLSNIGSLWGQQKTIRSQYEPCEDSTLNSQEFNGYSDSYQNLGSNDDFYDATSTNNSSSRRKDSEDCGWGVENEWSDVKSSSSIEQKPSKKSSSTNLAKKKSEKAKTNEDLLIDFGASSKEADKKNTVDDSWANWENDAWESLSKKD